MENEKVLKILILEDNEDDVALIERILRKDGISFVMVCVDTREEFTNAIRDFRPDVVLSDHGLPQFNSNEALKICLNERSWVPFILVTGTVSEEFAIASLKQGADDYILKSNLSRLPMAIRRAIKERRLRSLKLQAKRALKKRNSELLRVNEELVRANKELDSFVYSVSHNLRGPLSSVMGLLNLAKTEVPQEKLHGLHTMMESSLVKLDHTLKEILDYSKNARNPLSVDEINWDELIRNAIEKLSYIKGVENISWTIDIRGEAIFYTDKDRLFMILNSLLSNAVNFQDHNKETLISVEVASRDTEVDIVIRDNGVGIKSEYLEKVFDMFFRGSLESQGAGLGLYIARDITRVLHGQIRLESIYGKGTTLFVTLPNMKSGSQIKVRKSESQVSPEVR